MSDLFWIALIFTSPFWLVLGIVLIVGIIDLLETFLNLFKRKLK